MDLNLTPSAEKFIRRMVRLSGGAGGFRLAVTSGGCSGLSAAFDIEALPRSGDRTIEHSDLRFFIPEDSCKLLEGVVIDFMETPTSSGFIFHDPRPSSCQCAGGTVEAPKHNLHQLRDF